VPFVTAGAAIGADGDAAMNRVPCRHRTQTSRGKAMTMKSCGPGLLWFYAIPALMMLALWALPRDRVDRVSDAGNPCWTDPASGSLVARCEAPLPAGAFASMAGVAIAPSRESQEGWGPFRLTDW